MKDLRVEIEKLTDKELDELTLACNNFLSYGGLDGKIIKRLLGLENTFINECLSDNNVFIELLKELIRMEKVILRDEDLQVVPIEEAIEYIEESADLTKEITDEEIDETEEVKSDEILNRVIVGREIERYEILDKHLSQEEMKIGNEVHDNGVNLAVTFTHMLKTMVQEGVSEATAEQIATYYVKTVCDLEGKKIDAYNLSRQTI